MKLIIFLTLLNYFYLATIAQVVPIDIFLGKPNSYNVTGGNGVQIYVEEKGDPEKTTILLTCGYHSTSISWDSIWLDPDVYKRFHLVRWDYRGTGQSEKPADFNAYSLDLHAQ